MEPIIHIGDGVGAAELDDATLVFVWQLAATRARFEWQVVLMDMMAAKPTDGFLMLDIIASTASPPPAPLRRRMQEVLRQIAPRLRKLVVVALGDSIWLSVVRTIMRALALFSGQSERQEVVATLDEGIAAMIRLGCRPSAAELKRAVELVTVGLGMTKPPRAASAWLR